jgi:hypothetical protein
MDLNEISNTNIREGPLTHIGNVGYGSCHTGALHIGSHIMLLHWVRGASNENDLALRTGMCTVPRFSSFLFHHNYCRIASVTAGTGVSVDF